MAQTKRKRRSTKHRGNAAGQVEARGRTSRAESSGNASKNGKPGERFDKAPEWRSAMNRAAIAAGLFGVMTLFLLKQKPLAAAALTVAVFCLYVPLGYYTDDYIYKRRQRKKQQAKEK
jgi:hypothetical protein